MHATPLAQAAPQTEQVPIPLSSDHVKARLTPHRAHVEATTLEKRCGRACRHRAPSLPAGLYSPLKIGAGVSALRGLRSRSVKFDPGSGISAQSRLKLVCFRQSVGGALGEPAAQDRICTPSPVRRRAAWRRTRTWVHLGGGPAGQCIVTWAQLTAFAFSAFRGISRGGGSTRAGAPVRP